MGSLTRYHIHVVDNNTFPSKNVFVSRDVPVDILAVSGYVFDGRVHCHITISDEHGVIGGHLGPGEKCLLNITD